MSEWLHWDSTQAVIAAFAGRPLRFVGGCVRDALLGREVKDVDAATPLLPGDVIALLTQAGLKAVPTGLAHGTVTAVAQGKGIEITTLRSDVACDGRHAQVAFTDDWQQDAARRDFTMNALYLTPQGELFDYFDGAADARAGKVRFIGDARQRIAEDYLRILRFFRFYAHYGLGLPDEAALAACCAEAGQIVSLSGERIQHEMLKLLAAPAPSETLGLMRQTGVLPQVLPEVEDLLSLSVLERQVTQPDAVLALAVLLRRVPDSAQACAKLARRWKLSTANAKRLQRLATEPLPLHNVPVPEQKRLVRALGKADFADLTRLAAAENPANETAYRTMLAMAESWEIPVFPVKGTDLLAAGQTAGAALGQALQTLEKEWEESGYTLSKDALLARLR